MRCSSVQRRLSTWANESHRPQEEHRVQVHLDSCEACRQYQSKVTRLDYLASEFKPVTLERDLLPNIERDGVRKGSGYVPRVFFARHWVAIGAAAVMILGATMSTRRGGAYSASAQEAVRGMESTELDRTAYHQSLWQAAGPHQEGQLELLDQVWYEAGKWREKSIPSFGGDRIFEFDKSSGLVRLSRDWRGKIVSQEEASPRPKQIDLQEFCKQAGIEGAEANAEDLGTRTLNGVSVREISIPTYNLQRTLVWLIPGTNLPVRMERQNEQHGSWTTSWLFTIEYAKSWPPSIFDSSTLESTTGGPTARASQPFHDAESGTTNESRLSQRSKLPNRNQPAFRTGNIVFAAYLSTTKPGPIDSACASERVAAQLRRPLDSLASEYGTLQSYGSDSHDTDKDRAAGSKDQVYNLRFGNHPVRSVMSFTLGSDGVWKATSLKVASSATP